MKGLDSCPQLCSCFVLMVWNRDYLRHPLSTLHDAVSLELYFWAFCLWCGHARKFDPRDWVHKYGATTIQVLESKFVCRKCGARTYGIMFPSPYPIPKMH